MNKTFDVDSVRNDFPILSRKNRGKPLAYLDNAASSQKPRCVIDAISNYYQNYNSNVHRGVYEIAEQSEFLYSEARKKIADYLSVPVETIIFVRGATEGLNLVARSFGKEKLNPGEAILLTEMEHHANIVPWQMIANEMNAEIKVVPVLSNGTLDLEILTNHLKNPKVKILSLCAISNTLGTINPLSRIIKIAREYGTYVVVDGSQSVPHQRPNLNKIDCDFFVFSGHKVFGPMGIGVVYGKKELLDSMPPYQGGGDMIEQVSFEGSTFASSPQKFEAGTPNVADAIGLGHALEYLQSFNIEEISNHESNLMKTVRDQLSELKGFQEYGFSSKKAAVLSFSIQGVHPHDLASVLDAEGITIRSGHHCCQPLMKKIGVESTARASFALYNTTHEAKRLANGIIKASKLLN